MRLKRGSIFFTTLSPQPLNSGKRYLFFLINIYEPKIHAILQRGSKKFISFKKYILKVWLLFLRLFKSKVLAHGKKVEQKINWDKKYDKCRWIDSSNRTAPIRYNRLLCIDVSLKLLSFYLSLSRQRLFPFPFNVGISKWFLQ